jgi:hypothetical protein
MTPLEMLRRDLDLALRNEDLEELKRLVVVGTEMGVEDDFDLEMAKQKILEEAK